jgi:hypothetical protein
MAERADGTGLSARCESVGQNIDSNASARKRKCRLPSESEVSGGGDFVERLHDFLYDPNLKVKLFGLSSALELYGTVKPSEYPPVNGRIAKALRYLGFNLSGGMHNALHNQQVRPVCTQPDNAPATLAGTEHECCGSTKRLFIIDRLFQNWKQVHNSLRPPHFSQSLLRTGALNSLHAICGFLRRISYSLPGFNTIDEHMSIDNDGAVRCAPDWAWLVREVRRTVSVMQRTFRFGVAAFVLAAASFGGVRVGTFSIEERQFYSSGEGLPANDVLRVYMENDHVVAVTSGGAARFENGKWTSTAPVSAPAAIPSVTT